MGIVTNLARTSTSRSLIVSIFCTVHHMKPMIIHTFGSISKIGRVLISCLFKHGIVVTGKTDRVGVDCLRIGVINVAGVIVDEQSTIITGVGVVTISAVALRTRVLRSGLNFCLNIGNHALSIECAFNGSIMTRQAQITGGLKE